MFNLFSLFFNPLTCDAPEAWQIGFQDGRTPTYEGITELHNSIFFYLIVIFIGVTWALGSIIVNFSYIKNEIVMKYLNHGFKLGDRNILLFIRLFIGLMNPFRDLDTKTSNFMLSRFIPVYFENKLTGCFVESTREGETKYEIKHLSLPDTRRVQKGMDGIKNLLSMLNELEDKTVYNWLTTLPEIQSILEGNVPNLKVLTKDGNAFRAKISPINSLLQEGGVYLVFNSEDGQTYVGSTLSFNKRIKGHIGRAASWRRNLAKGIKLNNVSQFQKYLSTVNLNHIFVRMFDTGLNLPSLYTLSGLRVLTRFEARVLDEMTSTLYCFYEQAIMNEIKPSLNTTPVKFKSKWSYSDKKLSREYEVFNADTGESVFKTNSKNQIVRFTNKTLNEVTDYLDHEKSVYSKKLGYKVFIRTADVMKPLKTGAVQTSWVVKTAITGFDPSNLPDGKVYLLDENKNLIGKSFMNAKDAAWVLDGKSEGQYIQRYVNVERMVNTSQGSFYFVKNMDIKPDYTSATAKPYTGQKGKPSPIVLYDKIENVYVQFKSKNAMAKFLVGRKSLGGEWDRYLYNGVEYYKRFLFFTPLNLPDEATSVMSPKDYFSLIGSENFIK